MRTVPWAYWERPDRSARCRNMAFVFFMTLPGLAVGLVVLAAVDRLGWWVSRRSRLPWYRDRHRPVSAIGLDELQSAFHAGKRHAIEQRKLELVLRDDEHDGAPPRVRVDLTANRVVITGSVRPPGEDPRSAVGRATQPTRGLSSRNVPV
jgi:hypothetical protein